MPMQKERKRNSRFLRSGSAFGRNDKKSSASGRNDRKGSIRIRGKRVGKRIFLSN